MKLISFIYCKIITCPSFALSIPSKPYVSRLSLIADKGLEPIVFFLLPASFRNSVLEKYEFNLNNSQRQRKIKFQIINLHKKKKIPEKSAHKKIKNTHIVAKFAK